MKGPAQVPLLKCNFNTKQELSDDKLGQAIVTSRFSQGCLILFLGNKTSKQILRQGLGESLLFGRWCQEVQERERGVRQGKETSTYRTHEWSGYHCRTQSHWDLCRYSGKGAPELFTKGQDAGELIHRSKSSLAEGPQGAPNSASYQARAEVSSGGRRLPFWEAADRLRGESRIRVGYQQGGQQSLLCSLSNLVFLRQYVMSGISRPPFDYWLTIEYW